MFYYVALHNGKERTRFIAGPYEEETKAIAAKQKAWDRYVARDDYAWFYTCSLAKSEREFPTLFGPIAV